MSNLRIADGVYVFSSKANTDADPALSLDTVSAKLDTLTSAAATQTTLASVDTRVTTLNTSVSTTNASIGATNVAAATGNTGTFSLLGAVKRFLSHFLSTKSYYGDVVSNSGANTIIAAPSAGQQICIHTLRIQSGVDVPSPGTLILIRRGVGGATPLRLRTTIAGSGMDAIYGPAEVIRCGDGNAFILDLSLANTHDVSVTWHIETISTGLPV